MVESAQKSRSLWVRYWRPAPLLVAACSMLLAAAALEAGSVREATAVSRSPAVDAADFFLFRSYEPGRDGYVVLIATYNPLQEPAFGGPNHYPLDTGAIYEIHVANDGDAEEDVTFRFNFDQRFRALELEVGLPGAEESVPIAQVNAGEIRGGDESGLNVLRSYTVKVFRHGEAGQQGEFLTRAATGAHRLRMPFDDIGDKSIPDYERYSSSFVYEVNVPGCDGTGRVFVGQREDPFRGNLGEFYDLINVDMIGTVRDRASDTAQERHGPRSRGAHRLPDRRRQSGDRRLDYGEPSPRPRAEGQPGF